MRRVFKIGAVIALICVVAYVGSCAYINFINPTNTNAKGDSLPNLKEAPYQVTIQNTHSVYFTPAYDRYGRNNEVVILHGYWEMVGKEYVYRNIEKPLDESKFGPIEVRIRAGG